MPNILPIIETLDSNGDIVEAIVIKHQNGHEWLKPVKELDCSTFITCINESITMALWRSDPGMNGDTVRQFDSGKIHPRQQGALAKFMGIKEGE